MGQKQISLINDYKESYDWRDSRYNLCKYIKKIKQGLSFRNVLITEPSAKNYYGGMVWGADIESAKTLLLFYCKCSSEKKELQQLVVKAREKDKPLIIINLDNTPLTMEWELILADYKQCKILDYDDNNPNETIFEVEMSFNKFRIVSKTDLQLLKNVICMAIFAICLCLSIVAFVKGYVWQGLILLLVVPAVFGAMIVVGVDLLFNKNVSIRSVPKRKDESGSVLPSHKEQLEYKCFIAGSVVIEQERNTVIASIDQVDDKWQEFNIKVSAKTFEYFGNNHQQQKTYDEFIENEADCALFIIADGVGGKTLGEYRLSVKTLNKTNKKRPAILTFADEKSQNDPTVIAFRKEVEQNGTYWIPYNSLQELKLKVKDELDKQLVPILKELQASK